MLSEKKISAPKHKIICDNTLDVLRKLSKESIVRPKYKYPRNFINQIINDDCLKVIKEIPNENIDLIITSPPYDNLRDYKGYSFDFKNIAKELFRVIKRGGIIVWIVGDATINGNETGTSFKQALYFKEIGFNLHDTMIYEKNSSPFPSSQEKGVRYSQIFEYMFVFSKGKPKTINLISDKKNRYAGETNWGKRMERKKDGNLIEVEKVIVKKFGVRNNIWRYNTGKGFSSRDTIAFEHPAIFPEKLVNDHIISWSDENDIILDPMCGSGTTCKMALINNRKFIGIEISKEYCEIALKRVSKLISQTKLNE